MNQNHKISLTKKSIQKFCILGILAFEGCCTPFTKNCKNDTNQEQTKPELTLIGKRVYQPPQSFSSIGILYYDTDGDLSTTEIIANSTLCCPMADAKFFDSRVGDKKSEQQWEKQLSHKHESKCYNSYLNFTKLYE